MNLPAGPQAGRRPAKIFQDLIVWQKVHQFVLSISILDSGS